MESMYSLYLIVILFLISLLVAFQALYDYQKRKNLLKEHLSETTSLQPDQTDKKRWNTKLLEKLFHYADDFTALGERFNFFSESEDVERWLMQSGYPYNLTVERFQGLKIVLVMLGFLGGIAAFILGLPLAQFMVILLPVAGYFSAIFWLKWKAKKRQTEISYALPDFLDMVSVTLQAGAGLEQALREISQHFQGPLGEEFTRFNQRINLGVPRNEAYKELIERSDVPEFQLLIKSLIQGAQLGIPVATTFKIQAEEIRKLKKEKAKEAASKASPQVTMITTFVVMPTAMMFIAGLLILNLISGSGGMFEVFNN